jgi:predicted dehydrogenase
MIRLGTIGTSGICRHFLSGVALTDKLGLTAVYSRTIDTGRAFGEAHGCERVFTDLEEMAKSDCIDAVYIASPNSCHYSQSKLFLENGKHVLCEKPIVTCQAEYEALKNLADRKGLIYMEAIMPLHADHWQSVREAYGKIGKPVLARLNFSQRSSRLDAFLRGEHTNIFDMSLHAGALMDLGVYCVYAAVDFFGAPKAITATAHFLHNGADGCGTAVFDYEDFSAVLTWSKVAQSALGSEIIGEKGVLKLASVSQYTGVTLVQDGREEPVTEFPSRAEIMRGEAERFARWIQKPTEEYRRVSEICSKVHPCMDAIKNKAGIQYPSK